MPRFTGSERFGMSVSFDPGTSSVEPGITPAEPVTLHWATLQDAANEAGMSRRYGGIPFKSGDLSGRALGNAIGMQTWWKAIELWQGRDGSTGAPDTFEHSTFPAN